MGRFPLNVPTHFATQKRNCGFLKNINILGPCPSLRVIIGTLSLSLRLRQPIHTGPFWKYLPVLVSVLTAGIAAVEILSLLCESETEILIRIEMQLFFLATTHTMVDCEAHHVQFFAADTIDDLDFIIEQSYMAAGPMQLAHPNAAHFGCLPTGWLIGCQFELGLLLGFRLELPLGWG